MRFKLLHINMYNAQNTSTYNPQALGARTVLEGTLQPTVLGVSSSSRTSQPCHLSGSVLSS